MSDPDYTHSAGPDASGTQSHAPTPSGLTYSLDPHATVTPDPLPVVPAGADIPGYVILEELGRGGMAVVNKARQITLSRTVALKTMLRADPVSRVRFLAEAEAVAAIKHPHVVQVFEVGEHAGTPYLAMEYVPGGTLAGRLAEGRRLAPAEAAALMAKVAAGVAAAHELGIVHRDLKPANVLLDAAGEPKVADFGLAKRAAGCDLTATQAMMGTPAYMAPEQVRGAKFAGPPADVWALGTILYQCLTGKRPFDGDNVETILNAVLNGEPAPLRSLVPGGPRDLDTIVAKCLTKEPDGRYPTAKELADDLGRFTRGETISARPTGPAERAVRWVRRNPRVAGLLSAVALLLVVIAAGSTAAAMLLRSERDAARKAESDAVSARDDARKAERDALTARDTAQGAEGRAVAAEKTRRQQLYRAYLGESRVNRTSGRVGQRFHGLEAIRSILAAIPPGELTPEQQLELQDEATACLALPDLRELARRPSGSSGIFDVDCDDRFDLYCFPDHAERCTVIRRGNDPATDVRLLPHPDPEHLTFACRKFNPDGRWLAEVLVYANAHTRLSVWDWAAQQLVLDDRFAIWSGGQMAFHPTAPELAIIGLDREVQVIDLPTRTVRRSSRRFASQGLSYSPDGRLLGVANDVGPTYLIDTTTLEPVESIPPIGSGMVVAWSPDGNKVAIGNMWGQVYIWYRALRRGHFLPGGHGVPVNDLKFSRDGQFLASAGHDGFTCIWSMTGNHLLVRVPGRPVRFGHDARRLAVADDREFVVYELTAGDEVRAIREPMEGAEFSPDGAYLAVSGRWGVRLFTADTLEPRADLGLNDCGPVAFRPDGGEVVTFGRFVGPWRWPIRTDGGRTVLGPAVPVIPERFPLELQGRLKLGKPFNEGRHAAWSRNGTVLAMVSKPDLNVQLADPSGKQSPRVLGSAVAPDRVAVSPDGRWVALICDSYRGVRVWDRDGKMVLDLPVHGSAAFSPDRRWFAVAWRQFVDLYEVGTWQRVRSIPRDEVDPESWSPLAFQPTTGLLAVGTSRRHVRLHDPETGKPVATLTHPESGVPVWLSFSPDGTRLAVTRLGVEVAVWDLVGIGVGVSQTGLPPGPFPAPAARVAAPAREVTVDRGKDLPGPEFAFTRWKNLALEEEVRANYTNAIMDITRALDVAPADPRERAETHLKRGIYRWQVGDNPGAVEDWLAARSLVSGNTEASIWLARVWAIGPPEVRDPLRAVGAVGPLSEQPQPSPRVLLYLGIAQVRLGRDRDGLDNLNKVAPADGGPIRDYYRAVALFRLGEKDAAQEALKAAREADERMAPGRKYAEAAELARARKEAEEELNHPPRP